MQFCFAKLHVYENKQNDLAKLFNFAKLLPLAPCLLPLASY